MLGFKRHNNAYITQSTENKKNNQLLQEIKHYYPCDVYSIILMRQFYFFQSTAQENLLSRKSLHGGIQSKQRVTEFHTSNADGSDILLSLGNGKYKGPHQLKNTFYYTLEEVDFCIKKCCKVYYAKAEVKQSIVSRLLITLYLNN